MFESSLKRELTPEERRLLSLSDLFLDEDAENDNPPAFGQTAS